MQLTGIHHLTAVTADAPGNHAFYTRTLGMRLVKRTVNQDDVGAYHLFYADGLGSPGSDLTFFDWPVGRERRGARSIVRTGLRVAGEGTLAWWERHLAEIGVAPSGMVERDGRPMLDLEDGEGQRLSLVEEDGAGPSHPWSASPVPMARQIRGLGPVTISVPELRPTASVLTRGLGMRQVRDYPTAGNPGARTYLFEMGPGGPGAELHVAVEPDLPPAAPG